MTAISGSPFFRPSDATPKFAAKPYDSQLEQRVAKLAEFAAKNGPPFVDMIRQKQQHNPDYNFLSGGAGAEYFTWRLYCHIYGLDPDRQIDLSQGQPAPHKVLADTHEHQSSAPRTDLPEIEQLRQLASSLSQDLEDKFSEVLQKLSGTRGSIKESKEWFMSHREHSSGLAAKMALHQVELANYEQQLHVIYLANDVLLKSMLQRQDVSLIVDDSVAQGFQPVLPLMLRSAFKAGNSTAEVENRLSTILEHWTTRQVYPAAVIEHLKSVMLTPDPPQPHPAPEPMQQHAFQQEWNGTDSAAGVAPWIQQDMAPSQAWNFQAIPPQDSTSLMHQDAFGAPFVPATNPQGGWLPGGPVGQQIPFQAPILPGAPFGFEGPSPLLYVQGGPPGFPPNPQPGFMPNQGYQFMAPLGQNVSAVNQQPPGPGWDPNFATRGPAAPDPLHSEPHRQAAHESEGDLASTSVDAMSFPPGLLPALVEENLRTEDAYAPLSKRDVDSIEIPNMVAPDAYLLARLDKFYAELRDHRPGITRGSFEDIQKKQRSRNALGGSSQADSGSRPEARDDGSFKGGKRDGGPAGLGFGSTDSRQPDDPFYQYRSQRSGVYHEAMGRASTASETQAVQ